MWELSFHVSKHRILFECGHYFVQDLNWNISSNDDSHVLTCKYCQYQVIQPHAFGQYEQLDNSMHSHTCTTCKHVENNYHNLTYHQLSSAWHTVVCTDCGYTVNETHTVSEYSGVDDQSHSGVCIHCEEAILLSHNYEPYNSCYEKCSECGYIIQVKEHDYTHRYESMTNIVKHYAYCECGAVTVEDHTFSTTGTVDICAFCKLEKDHVHEYTYVSCLDQRTHRKICSCGVSSIEACFGMTSPGSTTCCMMCGQTMNGGAIQPWSKEDELVPLDDENNPEEETE